jgi:benzoate 4-monooxygenase
VSPLRVLPGPFLAKFSNFWLLWAETKGCRTETIHSWHEKYGPIVRVGPNEISFSGVEHVYDIYGQSSVFMKGAIYDTFGRTGIFAMRDKYEHRERRRILNHTFTQSNLFDIEPLMKGHIQKLCHKIEGRQKTDVLFSFR